MNTIENTIENLNSYKSGFPECCYSDKLTNNLYNYMELYPNINYNTLREHLYSILIYDVDISIVIWKILSKYIKLGVIISDSDIQYINAFFQLYNNNYRPIYHLEKIIYYILNHIHMELKRRKHLGINEKDIHILSERQIKHKYHILALKYHPDKNKTLDATKRFQEIQEAYNIILQGKKQITKTNIDYRDIFKQYLRYYINESDDIVDLLYDIINKKMNTLLYNCSNSKLRKIYSFLLTQKELFNIPEHILKSIQQVIQEKTKLIELECSFKDIWEQKIYVLTIGIDTLYIPLWQSKLEYNIQGITYIIF